VQQRRPPPSLIPFLGVQTPFQLAWYENGAHEATDEVCGQDAAAVAPAVVTTDSEGRAC
jgi:hypothetical protein